MWTRAALVALACVVSILMQSHTLGCDHVVALVRPIINFPETLALVPVTKSSEAVWFPKSVQIADLAPHKQIAAVFRTPERVNFALFEVTALRPLHLSSSGDDEVAAIELIFIDWEIVQFALVANPGLDEPRHVSRWQLTNVSHIEMRPALSVEWLDTEGLNGQIGSLKDSGVAELKKAESEQRNARYSKRERQPREPMRVTRERFLRVFLPISGGGGTALVLGGVALYDSRRRIGLGLLLAGVLLTASGPLLGVFWGLM